MTTTETRRLGLLLFYGYVLGLAFLAFQIMQPFLMPLAWAGILTLCLWPLRHKLTSRLGKNGAALVITLLAVVVMIGPALWIGYSLVTQASQVPAGW